MRATSAAPLIGPFSSSRRPPSFTIRRRGNASVWTSPRSPGSIGTVSNLRERPDWLEPPPQVLVDRAGGQDLGLAHRDDRGPGEAERDHTTFTDASPLHSPVGGGTDRVNALLAVPVAAVRARPSAVAIRVGRAGRPAHDR